MLALEGRCLLSMFTVSRIDDAIDPTTLAPANGTLRWAVMQADSAPGSTIVFDQAVFATLTTIALSPGSGQLELSAPLTIEGPAATVTIDAQHQSRVFSLDPSVAATISGLSITGGLTTGYGGGVYVGKQSSLVLENCTISGSSAKEGGGAYVGKQSSLVLETCTISGSSAEDGGGVYAGQTELVGSSRTPRSMAAPPMRAEDFSVKARPRLRTARSPAIQRRSSREQSSPPIRPSL